MNRDYQARMVTAAIAAVYDAAAALDVAPDGRAHTALLAARSCILLGAALSGVPAPGAGAAAAHAAAARDLLAAAAPARGRRRRPR